MNEIYHFIEDGLFCASGKPLEDCRIKAYLREFGFAQDRKTWRMPLDTEQIAKFMAWAKGRDFQLTQKTPRRKTVVRIVKSKKNITYYYGKANGEDNSQLRGAGLGDAGVKSYIRSKGFKWTFRRGMRAVRAWEANYSPHKLIEILLHLKNLGFEILPSSSLPLKKWLYLDLPSVYDTKRIQSGDPLSREDLILWLEGNNYAHCKDVSDTGEFAPRGDTVFVWTKQDDALVRIVFDGDRVESIAFVEPDGSGNFVPEFTINGLKEIAVALPQETVLEPEKPNVISEQNVMNAYAEIAEKLKDMPIPLPPQPIQSDAKRRYSPSIFAQINKKFDLLDSKHPFYGMVKFGDNQK